MMQAVAPVYAPTAGSAAAPNSPRHRFYRRVLRELNAAGIDFVVGGGYALERHLGIGRPTKDLDLFLRPGRRAGGARPLPRPRLSAPS